MSILIKSGNNGIKFKNSDIRVLDDLFISGGYVLEFTNNTFSEFFEDEVSENIYSDFYSELGDSKGKRLRTFVQKGEPSKVKCILNMLWERKEKNTEQTVQFNNLISVVEGSGTIATDAIEVFSSCQTLEELVQEIKRDIDANKPQVALESLHTYCVKRFKYLLQNHNIEYRDKNSLENLVSLYKNYLFKSGFLQHSISHKIMKSFSDVWKEFNDVRNNKSLAHDNIILTQSEARYIFEVITAMLRFIKSIESN